MEDKSVEKGICPLEDGAGSLSKFVDFLWVMEGI